MPITNEQLQKIQDMVKQLVDDKGDADEKTMASNAADSAAVIANITAAQAKLDEAAADAAATVDLADLTHYLDSLVAPAPPA